MHIKKEQINPIQWTHYSWFDEHFEEPKVRTNQEVPGGSTPSQYGLPTGATELQDLIEHRNMNFAIGNIFKACYRLGNCNHSDKLRDLRKILWFAQRELDKESK